MENDGSEDANKDNSPNEDRPLTKREKRQLAKQEKLASQEKSENSGKIKKFVLLIVVVAAVIFGGLKLWNWINTPQPDSGSANVLDVKSDDWVRGSADAKVTVIEYADFECPACKVYATDVLPRIESDYGGNLRMVFRHFPLPQHKNAISASKAAEAAGIQGKFWEMADLLYQKQTDWQDVNNVQDKMLEYAKSLGLNTDQFLSDYGSDVVAQSIKDDEDQAYALRVNATPTFFVNGKKADVNYGYEDLKKAIDSSLSN